MHSEIFWLSGMDFCNHKPKPAVISLLLALNPPAGATELENSRVILRDSERQDCGEWDPIWRVVQ
jgi:hypothetical protein